MQFKKTRKVKINLFQKVKFDPESAETIWLVLVCAGIFGISSFASGKLLDDYNRKVMQSALNGRPERQIIESVLADESPEKENGESAEENMLPEGKNISETLSDAVGSVKELAIKTARAKKIAGAKAAREALLRNTPPPRTSTKRVDGKKICDKKNDKPHESGKGSLPHMDMECCPDPDEWPNPHCYYTPEQLSRMKKPPK